MAALFKEAWASVEEKTAVTREEFERAAVLGTQLHAALGARQVGAEGRTGSQELWKARQRAFSLFVRAYDECRRGVVFLRWHEGDADRYVPSIYRKRRRAVVVEEEGTEVTPELDEAPVTEAEVPVDVLGDSPIAAGEIFETT